MNKVLVAVIVVVIIAVGGYFFMQNRQSAPATEEVMEVTETIETASPNAMPKVITLSEQNESSQSGTAVLTETDGKVTVTLSVTGFPADIPQPAHIHVGSCPDVGAVAYPLANVVNGVSETVLNVTLADLAAKQPLGINVHKSVPEVKVYVACGDLNLPTPSGASTPAATGAGMMKY